MQRLAHAAQISHCEEHLIETDIAIPIAVQHLERLLCFRLSPMAQHLGHVLEEQRLATLDHKRHPDPARQSLGGLLALQCLRDNRVRRRGIEDMLSRDFLRNTPKRIGDLVAQTTNILAHVADNPAASHQRLTGRGCGQERVADDGVLVVELLAVHGEHSPRGVIEQTQQVHMALGLFDPAVELLPVVADGDEHDRGLLGEEDQTADEEREEDILD